MKLDHAQFPFHRGPLDQLSAISLSAPIFLWWMTRVLNARRLGLQIDKLTAGLALSMLGNHEFLPNFIARPRDILLCVALVLCVMG